ISFFFRAGGPRDDDAVAPGCADEDLMRIWGNSASRPVSRVLSPPPFGAARAPRVAMTADGHPSWTPVARRLVRPDPGRRDGQPLDVAVRSLFSLAPGGVYLAGRSPGRRWALTPPFHRCRRRRGRRRLCLFCGTLLRVTPTGCCPAPCSV